MLPPPLFSYVYIIRLYNIICQVKNTTFMYEFTPKIAFFLRISPHFFYELPRPNRSKILLKISEIHAQKDAHEVRLYRTACDLNGWSLIQDGGREALGAVSEALGACRGLFLKRDVFY